MKNANSIDEKHIISCNIQQCISIIEHYQRIEEHENPHNMKENEKVTMMMMKLTLRKRRDEEERKNECRQMRSQQCHYPQLFGVCEKEFRNFLIQ